MHSAAQQQADWWLSVLFTNFTNLKGYFFEIFGNKNASPRSDSHRVDACKQSM